METQKTLKKVRPHITHEVTLNGHKLYISFGEDEEGRVAEVFIEVSKEGTTLRVIINCFAILLSKALQHGVPLENLIRTFKGTQFPPAGNCSIEGIPQAESIIDLLFRLLEQEYGEPHD